ncbi:MAG TPA: tetratricopeptide repeat protein [Deltaproteobacteria bacterium]|nr:tetratricopeptide repeat protein [Deltaproteobacteria bacterium]
MIWWTIALAQAELPPPGLDRALARDRWHEVNAILEGGCAYQRLLAAVACAEGVTDAAIAHADAFQDALFHDAGLEYLAGLAHRYAGEDPKAIARYRAAIALDPAYDAAWYDLGELYLKGGRYAQADEAFTRVQELVSGGANAWLGPWRRAEVAALQHDAEGFEAHIKEALQQGFSFRSIAGLPNWRRFYADPALQDTLSKLLTVYAEPDVIESLRSEP